MDGRPGSSFEGYGGMLRASVRRRIQNTITDSDQAGSGKNTKEFSGYYNPLKGTLILGVKETVPLEHCL